jgi:hypothetical protein
MNLPRTSLASETRAPGVDIPHKDVFAPRRGKAASATSSAAPDPQSAANRVPRNPKALPDPGRRYGRSTPCACPGVKLSRTLET